MKDVVVRMLDMGEDGGHPEDSEEYAEWLRRVQPKCTIGDVVKMLDMGKDSGHPPKKIVEVRDLFVLGIMERILEHRKGSETK